MAQHGTGDEFSQVKLFLSESLFSIIMRSGKRNYLKGVMMSFKSSYGHGRCVLSISLLFSGLLFAGVSNAAAGSFSTAGNAEVAPVYKANRVAELNLAAYEDELIDCSALAGIHSWIGDDLSSSGAEVRKALNNDYWMSVSKAYLALAKLATGEPDLSKQIGARMRVLAAEFRDLSEAPASTANWSGWYALVDRCDSWRTDSPSRHFYTNGRQPPAQTKKTAEVARAPY